MNFWKASTLVLTAALGSVIAYGSIAPAQADQQPRMQTALSALQTAKANLEAATTDKGGYRAKALQATKDAIEETKKGIAFDNTHESKDEKKTDRK
jgi:hypothetical protein